MPSAMAKLMKQGKLLPYLEANIPRQLGNCPEKRELLFAGELAGKFVLAHGGRALPNLLQDSQPSR